MYFFFFLLILSSVTSITMQKRAKKSSKVQESDDDWYVPPVKSFGRIDQSLFESYATSLDQGLYTAKIIEAHTYARAIFAGLQVEINEWTVDKTKITRVVAESDKTEKRDTNNRDRRELIIIRKVFYIAARERTRWQLYIIALRNLITFKKPCAGFFELLVNIWIESENEEAMESALVGINSVNRRKYFKDRNNNNDFRILETKAMRVERDIDIIKNEFQRLRKTTKIGPVLVSKLQVLYVEMSKLESENEKDLDQSISMQESISHIQLQVILEPLIRTTPFIQELIRTKRTIEPIKKRKEDITSQIALEHYNEFIDIKEPDYIAQRFRSLKHLIYPIDESLSKELVGNVLGFPESIDSMYIRLVAAIKISLNEAKERFRFYKGSLFRSKSAEYAAVEQAPKNIPSQVITEELQQIDNRISEILDEDEHYDPSDWSYNYLAPNQIDNTHLSTPSVSEKILIKTSLLIVLKKIMGDSDYLEGAASIKWTEVVHLIEGMKGTVTENGGSIRIIHLPLPNSFPIRFDRPHPGNVLGDSVYTLRKIFRKWDVDVDLYEE